MNVNWRILACRRHRKDLSLVATGLMTESEAPAALQHLADCPACQHKVAQWQSLARIGAQSSATDPSIFPQPSLRERWTQQILDASPREPAVNGPLEIPAPWAIGTLWRQPAGLLALAWLLVAFFWFSAPRISKAPASGDALSWRQIIAVLQPPSEPAPQTALPAEAPTARTNSALPGPLGQQDREPSATNVRKA
jgi:anti-sigma factor RsiW